eukprot:TRINITY_DN3870_c0_g1_i1.p1 TRINITY_DN3870_c0_g1~~TRINITY_DN3870_c0_g1_i1.p1  ORF type:complete len:167 (-),score=62.85 TRINITY_DN3870_c0_g1_i1:3-503(-)
MTKTNPRNKVPVFIDGEVAMYEADGICNYLEAKYPSPSMYPEGDQNMAKAAQYWSECDAYLYPTNKDESDKETREALKKELMMWDERVGEEGYLFDTFSVADAALFPIIALWNRCGLDFARAGLNNLDRYFKLVSELEFVQKTWPPHWLENEPSLFLYDVMFEKKE